MASRCLTDYLPVSPGKEEYGCLPKRVRVEEQDLAAESFSVGELSEKQLTRMGLGSYEHSGRIAGTVVIVLNRAYIIEPVVSCVGAEIIQYGRQEGSLIPKRRTVDQGKVETVGIFEPGGKVGIRYRALFREIPTSAGQLAMMLFLMIPPTCSMEQSPPSQMNSGEEPPPPNESPRRI